MKDKIYSHPSYHDIMQKNWKIFSYQLPLVSGALREGLIVRIGDGWGEIAPFPGRSHESLSQAHEQLVRVLTTGHNEELFPSVRFGLESALTTHRPWTAPLYAFLQGTSEEILRQADIAERQGFKTVKVKTPSKEVLQALKGRFRLRIDCNNALSFDEAVAYFDGEDFDYIEDPTFETDRLAEFPYPFALDEKPELKKYPNLYGFVLKPTILGGKKGCAPFVEFAKQNGLKVILSPAYESGLGLWQIGSLAAHFGITDPIGLDTHRYLSRDILSPGIDFSLPQLSVSGAPKVNLNSLKEIAHGQCPLPIL